MFAAAAAAAVRGGEAKGPAYSTSMIYYTSIPYYALGEAKTFLTKKLTHD